MPPVDRCPAARRGVADAPTVFATRDFQELPVSAITEDAIRELAGFRGGTAPVTSCYLDVDGRRYVRRQDYERQLDGMLREARNRANGTSSVHQDLDRIEGFVKQGVDRSRTRGLAIFACSAHGLFEAMELPVSVRNQVVVNDLPAVGQLEAVVQERTRLGVLLVDKQRARIFVFELGRLVDRSELIDELPRDYDQRGERERGDVANHVEELAHQHVRRAARALFDVHQRRELLHVSIGCPDELIGTVEATLHPYLRERLSQRIGVPAGASLADIEAAAGELEIRLERDKEARMVAQLRDAVGTGRRAVSGLPDVLDALGENRVSTLLVSHGYREPGWRCESCDRLYAIGRSCPLCGGETREVDDVVEEAVEQALARSAKAEICVDNADLDVLGGIGAMLRF